MKPCSPLLTWSLCSLANLGSSGCGGREPLMDDEVAPAPAAEAAPSEVPPSPPPPAPAWIPASRYDQPFSVKVQCTYAYHTDGRCGGGPASLNMSGANKADLIIQRQGGETLFQIAKLWRSSGAASPNIEAAAAKFDGNGRAEVRLQSNDPMLLMTQAHVITLQSGRLQLWMQRMEEERRCNSNRGQTTCQGSIEWDGYAPAP